jgi:hypothetical protein
MNNEEALKMLQVSAAKIDQSLLKGSSTESISKVAFRKMLRLVDEHGANGIKSVKMLPNWSEGATPRDLPSGFRMIFDINAAPVVPAAFPSQDMFAGTMAFRVPEAEMANSPLNTTGLEVHPSDIVRRIDDTIEVDNQLHDAYAGIFENKKRGEFDYVHEYWVVVRGVDPAQNSSFQGAVESHAGQTMSSLLADTATMRQKTFNAQRTARAQQVSNVLKNVGITITPETIVGSDGIIDNVSNALNDDKASTAVLYSNAVKMHNSTLSGMILNENMRLGPVLLRGNPNNVTRNGTLDVFPSTTGTTMPLWVAAQLGNALQFDNNSKMTTNNACVWSGAAEYHPLLARNAYRGRTQSWKRMESGAGFTSSVALNPVAVKLAAQK